MSITTPKLQRTQQYIFSPLKETIYIFHFAMALSSKLMIKFWLLLNITFLIGISTSAGQLSNEMYYDNTCPNALVAIQQAVQNAVLGEARIGASLLRLHFHDCFVQVIN